MWCIGLCTVFYFYYCFGVINDNDNCCCLPFRFLPTATAHMYQTVIDVGCNEDTGACLHKQSPRLCNQLFVGVSGWLLDKLQSLQNAAARLVTGSESSIALHLWCDSSTGFQFGRDWSLIRHFWSALTPVYLVDYCKATSVNQYCSFPSAISQFASALCSTDKHIPRRQEFCRLWAIDVEHAALRSTDIYVVTFRTQLKTFLFNCYT